MHGTARHLRGTARREAGGGRAAAAAGGVWGTRRSEKVTLLVALKFFMLRSVRSVMRYATPDAPLPLLHSLARDARPRALRPWRTQYRSHDKRLSVPPRPRPSPAWA